MFAQFIADTERRAQSANPDSTTDYTAPDGLRYCGVCRHPKQARIRKPECMGGGEMVVTVTCECINRRNLAESEEKRRMECNSVRQRVFHGGIGAEQTFARDDGKNPDLTKLCRRYAEKFTLDSDWLLLYGVCDAGKSYMAAAVANELIDRGVSVIFTSIAEIQNRLWNTNDKAAVYDRLCACGLLVIDDMFAERDSDYMNEIRFEVIDGRYRSGRPAVITTNLTMSELQNPLTTARGRIISRLYERSIPVCCEGRARRKRQMNESAMERVRRLME